MPALNDSWFCPPLPLPLLWSTLSGGMLGGGSLGGDIPLSVGLLSLGGWNWASGGRKEVRSHRYSGHKVPSDIMSNDSTVA